MVSIYSTHKKLSRLLYRLLIRPVLVFFVQRSIKLSLFLYIKPNPFHMGKCKCEAFCNFVIDWNSNYGTSESRITVMDITD